MVVLEVIQLQGPEGEQQAVAVLAGDGMEMVDETGTVTGTASVVNADGDTSLEGGNEVLEGLGPTTTFIVEPAKRGGRRGARIKVEPIGVGKDEDEDDDDDDDAIT